MYTEARPDQRGARGSRAAEEIEMAEMKFGSGARKTAARTAAKKVAPQQGAPAKRPRKAAPPAPADRESRVRLAAYLRAEHRGFAPGYEIDDWLAAEAEVGGREPAKPVVKPRKAPAGKPRAG